LLAGADHLAGFGAPGGDNAAMVGRYAIEAYQREAFIDPNLIDIVSTKKQQSGTLL